MQLRYNFRLYPTPGQRQSLAQAFGCARVVFNDGLRARQDARRAGLPYITDGALLKQVTTDAKLSPERAWLGDVSSVVLQQAVADLNTAYRNFFASLTGKRKGRKLAPPRFRSRKDNGSRSGSPETPGSGSHREADCRCRRSATWRSAGPETCPPTQPR